jgi:cobalt-zinc-cadmium efflux system protein
MPHDHSHHHEHAPTNFGHAFAVGIFLNTIFVIFEVVYGLLAHSLALVADASHNLSDVLGLVLAWSATVLTRRAASARHTYGLQRSSILVAIFNAIFLLISVGAIAWEAIHRLHQPPEVATPTIIWVALLGIIINATTAFMFMSGRKVDLNIRGVFIHMAADAAISAGVVVGAVIIYFTNWFWLDPILSLLISAVIIWSTWGLLRDAINLSLDAVPKNIDVETVHAYLLSLPGVNNVHHLHIWGLSTSESALTVHLVVTTEQNSELLRRINDELLQRFRIGHATIQFEPINQYICTIEQCL